MIDQAAKASSIDAVELGKMIELAPNVPRAAIAVLVSGGVESAILTALLCKSFDKVQPIYIRFGLSWESAEEKHLAEFLCSIANQKLSKLKVLQFPINDVYDNHWSVGSGEVPDQNSPDEAVYLPGRNIALLAKTAIWCMLQDIPVIAMGQLKGNPFPDATAEFFERIQLAVSMGLNYQLTLLRPFSQLTKNEVLELGRELPLHQTFSCIDPVDSTSGPGLHCGRCNKCAERKQAFEKSELVDLTCYASSENSLLR